jgi:hypothetical protein
MKNKITHKEHIERDTERGWEVQHRTVKQEWERLVFSASVVLGSIFLAGVGFIFALLTQ